MGFRLIYNCSIKSLKCFNSFFYPSERLIGEVPSTPITCFENTAGKEPYQKTCNQSEYTGKQCFFEFKHGKERRHCLEETQMKYIQTYQSKITEHFETFRSGCFLAYETFTCFCTDNDCNYNCTAPSKDECKDIGDEIKEELYCPHKCANTYSQSVRSGVGIYLKTVIVDIVLLSVYHLYLK